MFHRNFLPSYKMVMITWLCFKIFTSNLVNMETQSSSQSCHMDISEPVVMSLKTWEDYALEESLFESCKLV